MESQSHETKKLRFLYAFLFGLVGSIGALLAGVLIPLFIYSILYMFVFGDDPWPFDPLGILLIIGGAIGVICEIGIIGIGYRYGKKQDQNPDKQLVHRRAKKHLVIAIAIFVISAIFIGLRVYTSTRSF